MNEELALQIKAYDEFTAIFARFSSGLEGTEKASLAMVGAVDGLNKTVLMLADAIQKIGPPQEQRNRALQEGAKAEKELTDAVKKHSTELKGQEQAEQKSGESVTKHTRALTEEQKAAKAAKDAESQLKTELQAKKKADEDAADATKKHSDQVNGLLQGLGAMGILAALKRGLQEVTTTGAGFNQQLGIQKGLTGQAIDVSQAYLMSLQGQQKGVTELALGLNELGRAGYEGAQGMQALPELATFSVAAMDGLEKSMAPVVTILKTFQLGVKDTGQVTDVLTMAANKSALGFDDFQLGLAMSAGVARLAGQSYQELVAELSVLKDAGLGASDAGTSIKSAWMALMNPTTEAKRIMADLGISVYDNNGKMKSWADIVASTETALKPLNEQSRNLALTTIFGSDGVRAMALSMGRGSEHIRSMTEELKNSKGATTELAHEMGNTFTGAMERTQANVEKLKIAVFDDLKGAFSGLLGVVDTVVTGFNSLSPAMRGVVELLIGSVGLVGAIAAVATLAKSTLIPILAGLPALFTATAASAEVAGGAMAAFGGAPGIALLAIGALVMGITAYVGAQEKAKQAEHERSQSLLTLSARYDEARKAVDSNIGSAEDHKRAVGDQQKAIQEIGDKFPELVKRWDSHGRAIELHTELLDRDTAAALRNEKVNAEAAYSKAKDAVDRLEKQRATMEGQIKLAEQPHSNAAKGFFMMPNSEGIPQFPPVADNFLNSSAEKLKQDMAEVNKELVKANAELNREFAKLYGDPDPTNDFLRPGRPNPGGTGGGRGGNTAYDPDAEKKAAAAARKAEEDRTKAIRDQMDLMKHLMAMDDQRVDTAGEQLAFLERIRGSLGTTRDLDEAIYKLEQQIVRQPLQDQLAAFERRKQLGEVTARDEAQFYTDLTARASELNLTEKERQEYQVRGIVAQKAAQKELMDTIQGDYRYRVDLENMSTAEQIRNLNVISNLYEQGSKERKALTLEVHRLEQQLQSEQHDQRLAEIDFDAIVQRQSDADKLARLKDYLATEASLTVAQKRDLQKTIAQMEMAAETDHQRELLDLYKEGHEAERRLDEAKLRAKQKADEQAKGQEIKDTRNDYDGENGRITKLRRELEAMQDQTKEMERQKRLQELRTALAEKEAEIAGVKSKLTRIVVERDSSAVLGFRVRRTYDETRVGELEKERDAGANRLAEEKDRQAREKAQEHLQSQIRDLEQERDAKLQALNQQLSDLKDSHSQQLDALNLYWAGRLTTQAIQSELEQKGWKTHYDDVLKKAQLWVKDMNAAYAKLQQPMLDRGADLSQQFSGARSPAPAASSQISGGPGNVTVNQYGDHHYDGVGSVEEATQGMMRGARRVI